jgi:hypothetical protein
MKVFAFFTILPLVAATPFSIFDDHGDTHAALKAAPASPAPIAHAVHHAPAIAHPVAHAVHHAPAAVHTGHAGVFAAPAPIHHAHAVHHAPVAHAVHHAPIVHPSPAPSYGEPAPIVHPAPAPGYGEPAPVVHHPLVHHPAPAPGYGHPAPAPVYHPAPAYGHAHPTHNCSVVEVVEPAETCTPTVVATCENVALPIKTIVDVPYTYTITRTVCTETIQVIPQEVCVYKYQQKSEDTTAKTAEVTYKKVTDVQMITVCQPGPHGYGGYGHNYCKEVAQETAYNVPVVTPVDVPVTVKYPEPQRVCVEKPINLPVVGCEDLTEEKTIMVPTVVDEEVLVAACTAGLGEPDCNTVDLTLPKQVCKELVYGHAETQAPKPTPAPAKLKYRLI